MFGRRKIATLVAEFLGTGVLTLLILSVQRSTIGVPFFVAMAAGLTLALMTFALAGNSRAHFNPAITLAMWTARKISTVTGLLYIVVQMLGAWGAYWLYNYYVTTPLQPVGGDYKTTILVAEAVGTAIFAFGVAAAFYQRFSPAVTASVAGLAYMIGIVAASSASIGLLNPAVALGVNAWEWGTYVLGPVIGAIVGVNLFGLLFAESAVATAKVASSTKPVVVKKPAAKKKKTTRAKK